MRVPQMSPASQHSSADNSSCPDHNPNSDLTEAVQNLQATYGACDSPIPSIEAGAAIHGEADRLADRLASLDVGSTTINNDNNRLSTHKSNRSETTDGTNFLTARGLYNATPRPSPSPVPESTPGSTGSSYTEGVLDSPSERSTRSRPKGTEHIQNDPGAPLEFDFKHLNLEDEPRPYRVEDETFPPGPYFQSDFQNALKEGIKLAGTVADSIAHCRLAHEEGSSLKTIFETAKSLRQFKSPRSRTIGVVGSSGTGKSSLINSLLHQPKLAHIGDHGSAVTSFVTEYRGRDDTHMQPFTVEVNYRRSVEIDELLEELLLQYRKIYMDGYTDDMNETEYSGLVAESEEAHQMLKSIFPDRQEVTPDYLKDESEGAFNRILEALKSLAMTIVWPDGASNGLWIDSTLTSEECHDLVSKFMKQALWPLIKIVRIYLSAQVLKTGAIIADLPGYGDSNLARAKVAERYLLGCDEVFLVAGIERVLTDKSVENIIREQLGGSLQTAKGLTIVCTHAEDIDMFAPEDHYCKNGAVSKTTASAAKAMENAARSKGVDAHELAKIKYLFMRARNVEVTTGLRLLCGKMVGIKNVDVFCVANKDYQGSGDESTAAHNFAVKNSGIPDLRRFCHSIMGRAHFRSSYHFLNVGIAGPVQSLQLWLEAAPTQQGHTYNTLKSIGRKSQGTYQAAFTVAALEASNIWALTYHHTSYKAFVRNYGTHTTAAINHARWNKEILERMNAELGDWSELENLIETHLLDLEKSIKAEVESFAKQMRAAELPPTLLSWIKTRERDITYQVVEEATAFLENFRSVKLDATGDHMTSMILVLLIPTYRACCAEAGTGSTKRMHQHMKNRLQQGDIFKTIGNRLRLDLAQHLDEATEKVKNHVAKMYSIIESEIATVRKAEVQTLGAEAMLRLRAIVHDAMNANAGLQREAEMARAEARKLGYIP